MVCTHLSSSRIDLTSGLCSVILSREEFFNKKKSKPSEAENSDSDKEASQSTTFPCDQCENVSKNEKGLKIGSSLLKVLHIAHST